MKVLTFTKAHKLARLADELETAAIPSLAPIGTGEDRRAVYTVAGNGSIITLRVPDNADTVAIQAVIDAHDPTKASQGEIKQQTINEARAWLQANSLTSTNATQFIQRMLVVMGVKDA